MHLTELLGKKAPIEIKGLCDDLFRLVIEFIYRRNLYGWDNDENKEMGLSSLDVNVHDESCLELFLCWCELVFGAYDYDFIKMMIEAKYDCLIRKCLDYPEVLRVKYLKSVLMLPQLFSSSDNDKAIESVLNMSISLISPETCCACIKNIKGTNT